MDVKKIISHHQKRWHNGEFKIEEGNFLLEENEYRSEGGAIFSLTSGLRFWGITPEGVMEIYNKKHLASYKIIVKERHYYHNSGNRVVDKHHWTWMWNRRFFV